MKDLKKTKRFITIFAGIVLSTALVGCVSYPTGPSVMVLPGSQKSFDDFNNDYDICKKYAFNRIGPRDDSKAVPSAIIGTAIGAVAGAAMGGNSESAGVGAGMGLIAGSMMGAEREYAQGGSSQRVFNQAYIQCMYSKGHRVPVSANMIPTDNTNVIQPPPGSAPPPPPPSSSAPIR